ncbi:MAG TPA: FAD-binding protein, partial [Candidatus Babeliaceae bacterium]|nr:FAD-binding protein [Candidatus Babeliaceae bacterium]
MSVLLERQQFVSLGIRVQTDIDLADKNWFQTGGKAQWFAEPETADEFQLLLQKAYVNGWPLFILGQGANILIADQGFNGLVIRPQMNKLSHYDLDANTVILRAEAG